MRKLLLAFLTVSTVSTGKPAIKYVAVPYVGYINYVNSIRDKGEMTGLYNYLGIGLYHSVEGELDYTKIKYKTLPDLNQYDFTLLYTNYRIKNSKIRAGYHYISSDDKYTDEGHIFTAGYTYYRWYSYDIGIDLNYTYYKNYRVGAKKGLSIYQVTPEGGYYFGDYYRYGSFYGKIKGYYIKLSDDLGSGKEFYSLEGSLDYFYKKYVLGVSGWAGEQSFAVRNHGFVVYNLAEKYKRGFSVYMKYILNKNINFTGKYSQNTFKERGTDKDSTANSFVFTVGASF